MILIQLPHGGFVIAGVAEEDAERSINGLHSGLTDGNGFWFKEGINIFQDIDFAWSIVRFCP